jgi:hypothetical protein
LAVGRWQLAEREGNAKMPVADAIKSIISLGAVSPSFAASIAQSDVGKTNGEPSTGEGIPNRIETTAGSS